VRSNGLLKWLLIPLVLVVVFLGIKWPSGGKPSSIGPLAEHTDQSQLTPAEMKSLGVDGDTPRDTVATLVAQVKQLRTELKSALDDTSRQKKDNDRLRGRESDVDQRIQSAIAAAQDRSRQDRERAAGEQQQTQGLLHDLQHRLDDLTDRGDHADLPIGLGLDAEDAGHFGDEHLHWVEPQGAPSTAHSPKNAAKDKGSSLRGASSEHTSDTSTDFASEPIETAHEMYTDADRRRSEPTSAKAIYTLPSNATLIGSTAMTALIGRVPIDGTVNDPYPFKVLVGADNLTANGIDLPDVQGAVISGTASGDWTLSCVRGQIRSVTFVFQDGTIRTVNPSSSANGEAGDTFRSGLGWISDPYGIPCVSGERRSNAEQYLGSQMLITAAGAGAASLVDSKSANVSYLSSGANGNTLGTVGITGNEAMGRILAGGVQEMSQWVNKLYGQAFAAVYVPPGAPVVVHLEQPVEIDYDAQGRKVKTTSGGIHASVLD
jgi:integrating conjugative element protein (TIGR03752 family)